MRTAIVINEKETLINLYPETELEKTLVDRMSRMPESKIVMDASKETPSTLARVTITVCCPSQT